MAPQEVTLPGTRPTEGIETVDDISVRAGDPFFYAASQREDLNETPHGCYEGWVYLGFEGEDADGNPVEEIDRVPCHRCADSR